MVTFNSEKTRSIARSAAHAARREETNRYHQRRNKGDLSVPGRNMGLEVRKMAFPTVKGQEGALKKMVTEHFTLGFSEGAQTLNTQHAIQRLHDGVLNPEGYASPTEQVIQYIEGLGVVGRVLLEGIPVVNDIVDLTLLGAKAFSPDSFESKVSTAADFLLDDIPGYGLIFPEGKNELARDRIDEQRDMGYVKTIKSILSADTTSRESQSLARSFVQAMEQPHPYHALLHKAATKVQETFRPFTTAHQAAKSAGENVGVDIHGIAEQLLRRLKVTNSEVDAKTLVKMGDRLHAFATAELRSPKPMIEYTREIVALAPTAAAERVNEAKSIKSRRRDERKRRKQLELTAVKWDHAGQVGKELLDTYTLAKSRVG